MDKKLFLDTNIVIDIIDEARKSHQKAKETLLKIIDEDYEVYVSEDMISTIYYILKGNQKVLLFFKSILKEWNVVPFGVDVINQAIDFCLDNGSDLEDTMQCICAKNYECKLFLTNDKKFVDCGIDIVNYDRFLVL
jgi:predicted nucleic acid-binding protein